MIIMRQLQHRSTTLFLILLLCCVAAASDSMPPAEVQQLMAKTSDRYASIDTLKTRFVQVRKTRMLKEPAETEGRFYFKKPDKLLWEFTKPYRIRVFYTEDEVIKVDRDNNTYATLNVRKYKEPLLNILNVNKAFEFLDKYFIIKQIDTKLEDIYIIFIPKKRKVKKRIDLVEAWLDPETLLFRKIKVKEDNGTETVIRFLDTEINVPLGDDLFDVKVEGLEKEKWQE